ncbi:MAG: hypothetical protein SGPRY_003870, partial [Prymnesium sp.]
RQTSYLTPRRLRLRVSARLANGSSVPLLDSTPLTREILSAVSFYVYAAGENDELATLIHAPSQRKGSRESDMWGGGVPTKPSWTSR